MPASTLSSWVVTVPSWLTMPTLTLVLVASTSTAAANTMGRPSSSAGLIGATAVVSHRSAAITLSETPVSRLLPNARAQPATLSPNPSRKSRNWGLYHR